MWQCLKCGREFGSTGQHHYCGNIETVEQYILDQPTQVQPILQKVREVIRGAAPGATEKIAWRMPTYWQGENLIHFAAFKKHIGIYPGDLSRLPFSERLTGYHTTKGAIQFPLDKPLDYELIADIVSYRVSCAQTAYV